MHWTRRHHCLYAQRAGWRGEQKLGLAVAALAGVPKEVIKRARQNCVSWKAFRRTPPLRKWMVPNVFAFSARRNVACGRGTGKLDPDSLTPRQALEWIYRLKSWCNNNSR